MIQLTIGIPTYNRAESLRKLLEALAQERLDDDVEVLVSDNASLDSTRVVAEAFRDRLGPHFSHHTNADNLGFDGNILTLYRRARGRYVWFLSDDDGFVPGAVRRLADVARTVGDCGLIALPAPAMAPYHIQAGQLSVDLLPWRPSGNRVPVTAGERRALSGREIERLALVIATSQVSHCCVRRGVALETAERGGALLHSRLANLNLLRQPHYFLMPEPTVVQGPWTGCSQWFMESTLFGIRDLYDNSDMGFSAEAVDFVTVQTCLFGLDLLKGHHLGRLPVPMTFPAVGAGFADRLMRVFGGCYDRLAPAVREVLDAAAKSASAPG